MVTTYLLAEGLADYAFQSTSPQGGRLVVENFLSLPIVISIHVPTRGTTLMNCKNRQKNCNFNPRPHKGDDGLGSTGIKCCNPISIHVPTRGTTILTTPLSKSKSLFQSTSPQGGRHICAYVSIKTYCISIHVPTRGTTKTH